MKRLASYWLEKFLRFNRDPGGTGAFLDLVEDDDEGFLNRWNLREISSYGRMHFIPVELVLRTAAFEEQLGWTRCACQSQPPTLGNPAISRPAILLSLQVDDPNRRTGLFYFPVQYDDLIFAANAIDVKELFSCITFDFMQFHVEYAIHVAQTIREFQPVMRPPQPGMSFRSFPRQLEYDEPRFHDPRVSTGRRYLEAAIRATKLHAGLRPEDLKSLRQHIEHDMERRAADEILGPVRYQGEGE